MRLRRTFACDRRRRIRRSEVARDAKGAALLQGVTDAATLAAVQDVKADASTAKTTAWTYAARNLDQPVPLVAPVVTCPVGTPDPANTTCYRIDDVSLSLTTPYSVLNSGIPAVDIVHAEACRSIRTSFASVVGVRTFRVCSRSTAAITFGAKTVQPPGMLALGRPSLE